MTFLLWIALTASAERNCMPACDVNEICTVSGKCITPCIPACTDGQSCNGDGVCVGEKNIGASTIKSPNVGEATLCVERLSKDEVARTRWSVLIDGKTAGGLSGGTKECFETEPGTHQVVVTYLDPISGARPRAEKSVTMAPNGTVNVAVTSSGKDIVFQ
jgi:hypothetical protein